MLAVKSMDVRDNFKSLCDKVFRGETLIISRPKNENVVMLSEAEYNEMMKAKRNADYLAMIDKSMAEAEDKKIVKRINELIKSIDRDGLSQGLGKPEPLRYRKAWSRRITEEHRLVYNFDNNQNLIIYSCKEHYED